eukprot:CAMPEP_0177204720 /NCGR_PEP_ID=MMETSP0367-20130122/28486_1 /TAXON_ID=447022 ORGANISM="Scrippsiella hangoei-like, Strain SHHI-4" /NCGR_SAMPLE_ID=MMETSP0367 /ASSEMBLY_ACC=CAM_ASM_000362 /LENGTH=262 /DNA_ID=CAMNT_0018653411 /DNA_START=44 /DNA_END=829 /DNA_ORIENTATION=-
MAATHPGHPGPTVDPSTLQDIARDVGQQVELMILKAKHASETKVSTEISRIKKKMEEINAKIKLVERRLAMLNPGSEPMLKGDLQRSIDKLEEVWEGEVSTLKHELWQTIQAHNHNADLMKHHKEAIDQVQSRIAESSSVGPENQLITSHLQQVDVIMAREQAKQREIDNFMQRLAAIQHTVVGLTATWGLGGHGMPPGGGTGMGLGMQGMQGMQGIQPAGKKAAAKKQSKAKAKAPAAGGAAAQQAAAAQAAAAAAVSMRA